ncbi:MAG: hypothetical protein IT292_12230 [Deltaproteobacteria bacterium]|nr:hypothetical protein [Deltaproteobacteria bacterium]
MKDVSEKSFVIRFALVIGGFFAIMLTIVFLVRTFFAPSYVRPAEIIDLGEIRYLLDPKTHLRDKSVLVFFDEQKGWAAMSTRSTINGCDLTFLDRALFCPCSRIFWYHDGRPASGQTAANLPFFKLYYEKFDDGQGMKIEKKMHLLANTSEIVGASDQSVYFAPEAVMKAIPKIREINELQQVNSAIKVPPILRGKPDGSLGPMAPGTEYIRDYGKDSSK